MLKDFDPDAPGCAGEGLFGLPHSVDEARVVVVPVPFEATVSGASGTSRAPAAILQASLQVDLHDPLTDEPWRAGVAMQPTEPKVVQWNQQATALARPVIEAGGPRTPEHHAAVGQVDTLCEGLNGWLSGQVSELLHAGKIPGVLGGDHSVVFGAIQAAVAHHPGLGILHLDAHADLRESYEGFTWSHASIMYNVRNRIPRLGHILQVGVRDFGRAEARRIEEWSEVTTFTDHELGWELGSGEPWMRIAARMVRRLPKKVWVSFDIDALEPSNCPHTGTPVPGGLRWREACLLLQLLAEEHQIVGFDLCEVGDHPWDANVGARALYKLASWAIHTNP